MNEGDWQRGLRSSYGGKAGSSEIQRLKISSSRNSTQCQNSSAILSNDELRQTALDDRAPRSLTPSPVREESSSVERDSAATDSSNEQWRSRAARVLYRAGLRREARGRLSAAIGLYRQALKLDPGLDERSMYIEDHVAEENEEDLLPAERDDLWNEEKDFSCARRSCPGHVIGDSAAGATTLWNGQDERSLSETSLLCALEEGEMHHRQQESEGHCKSETHEAAEGPKPHASTTSSISKTIVVSAVNDKRADGSPSLPNQCSFRKASFRKGRREKKDEGRKEGEAGQKRLPQTNTSGMKRVKASFLPLAHGRGDEKISSRHSESSVRANAATDTIDSAACGSLHDAESSSSFSSAGTSTAAGSFGRAGGYLSPMEAAAKSTGKRTPDIVAALALSLSQRGCHSNGRRAGRSLPVAGERTSETSSDNQASSLHDWHLVEGEPQPPAEGRQGEGSGVCAGSLQNRCRSASELTRTREKFFLPFFCKSMVTTERDSEPAVNPFAADAAKKVQQSSSHGGIPGNVAGGDTADSAAAGQEEKIPPKFQSDQEERYVNPRGTSERLVLAGNNSPDHNSFIALCTCKHSPDAVSHCCSENAETQSNLAVAGLWTLPSDLLLSMPLFLDAYSLTRLSMSCRLMRDLCGSGNARCWEAKCLQVFGSRCSTECHLYGNSWNRMYLERPRLRMDGIYISRSVYLRRVRDVGRLHLDENEQESRRHRKRLQLKRDQELSSASVQLISDLMQNAQSPVLAVSYHRYLRFLPQPKGNRVLVLRTEAEKTVAVQALKAAEQRLQEVNSRNGSSNRFVVSPVEMQKEAAPSRNSSVADPSRSGFAAGGGGQHLCRTGRAWQWLLPLIAVGEYSFDTHSRRLHVFYNEPRSSWNRQPCTSGISVSGLSTRTSCNTRRQDTSESRRIARPVPLHESGQENSSALPAPSSFRSAEQSGRQKKSYQDLSKINKSYTLGGRSRRRYSHRAVFELCGGPSGRSNSRLRWISFSICSVVGQREGAEETTTTHLNINSEHFRPFVFSRVKSFEAFF